MSADRPTVSPDARRGDDRIDPRSRTASPRSRARRRSELALALERRGLVRAYRCGNRHICRMDTSVRVRAASLYVSDFPTVFSRTRLR